MHFNRKLINRMYSINFKTLSQVRFCNLCTYSSGENYTIKMSYCLDLCRFLWCNLLQESLLSNTFKSLSSNSIDIDSTSSLLNSFL